MAVASSYIDTAVCNLANYSYVAVAVAHLLLPDFGYTISVECQKLVHECDVP